jgi:hypothetical protein
MLAAAEFDDFDLVVATVAGDLGGHLGALDEWLAEANFGRRQRSSAPCRDAHVDACAGLGVELFDANLVANPDLPERLENRLDFWTVLSLSLS